MPAQIHLSNPVSLLISAPAGPQLTAAPASKPVAATSTPAAVPVPAQRRQLRLTRRGRLVFIGLPLMLTAAAALTVLGFFTAPAMASSGDTPDVTQAVQVSVGAGDSLWALAEEFAPDRDPRDVVADIMELNNLSDDRVPVGAQLFIPTQR